MATKKDILEELNCPLIEGSFVYLLPSEWCEGLREIVKSGALDVRENRPSLLYRS